MIFVLMVGMVSAKITDKDIKNVVDAWKAPHDSFRNHYDKEIIGVLPKLNQEDKEELEIEAKRLLYDYSKDELIDIILENKHNEKKVTALYARTSTAMQTTGLDAQIRALRRYCAQKEITDYNIYEDDEIENKFEEWTSRIHPDDLEKAMSEIENHLNGNTEVYENIHRMKHKNGSWVWMLDRGKALFDSNGKATRMVRFHTDITRNKELEENLQQLVEEKTAENIKQGEALQQQGKMAAMGEMIGAIAHQWRQPLGALSATAMNLEMKIELEAFDLDTKEGQKEQNTYFLKELEKIGEFIQNQTTTIDDFRDFYKPNKRPEKVLLEDIVKDSLEIVQPSLNEMNITIEKEYKPLEKINVYRNELIQVILNIIKNSEDKFLENSVEKPVLSIIVEENTISICDNGNGIPDNIIEHIFEPYFSTKDEKNGTGLGLYMSKIIVEEHHHGKLKALNKDDGVCFIIELGIIPDHKL